jgi:hypothetical protein
VKEFKTIKEAKDFLAGRIASEAEREGEPLSDVERKMLYFSEVDWTLPDMQTVSLEFDLNYDQNEYEQKISMLVRKVTARCHPDDDGEIDAWNEALSKLSAGDHYLTVLTNLASESPNLGHGFIPTLVSPAVPPPHDRIKLWAIAFAIVIISFAATLFYTWIRNR